MKNQLGPLVIVALLAGGIGWWSGRTSAQRFHVEVSGPNGINVLRMDRSTGTAWELDPKTAKWVLVPESNPFDRFDADRRR